MAAKDDSGQQDGFPRRLTGAEVRSGWAPIPALPIAGWRVGQVGKLVLRSQKRLVLVDEAAIAWIDGAGNYVRFNVGEAVHRVRATLGEVEQALQGGRFVRVQRSTILNLDAVREFIRSPYGDLVAVLSCGRRLTVGRAYRRNLEALFQARL